MNTDYILIGLAGLSTLALVGPRLMALKPATKAPTAELTEGDNRQELNDALRSLADYGTTLKCPKHKAAIDGAVAVVAPIIVHRAEYMPPDATAAV